MAHFLCQADEESTDAFGTNTTKHILHKREIVSNALAEAQNLESIKMRRTSMGGGLGGMKKDEQIRAAAELYARSGDLEKYCNIMFEDLGEHERALAVAPGVSMQFWQEVRVREERSDDADIYKPPSFWRPFLTPLSNTVAVEREVREDYGGALK